MAHFPFPISSVLLALLLSVPAGAQVREPDVEEIELPAFVERVGRFADAIEHVAPQDLTRVLVQVPSRLGVRWADERFDVPLEPIVQRLGTARRDPAAWAAGRHAIHAYLLEIRAEAEALLNDPPRAAGTDLRESLHAVLARKEFTRHAPSAWRDRLRERVNAWVRNFWDRLGVTGAGSRRVALGLAWLSALAALAAVLAWLLHARRGVTGAERPASRPLQDPPASAREWGLRAVAAARAGHTSEAVRCAYRAALKRLEEQGTWRVDDARTAREYVGLLPSGDSRRELFRDIARQFEQVLYANRPVAREEVVRLADHLETLGCVAAHERAI